MKYKNEMKFIEDIEKVLPSGWGMDSVSIPRNDRVSLEFRYDEREKQYEILEKNGYVIEDGRNPKWFWFANQRNFFFITKKTKKNRGIGKKAYSYLKGFTGINLEFDSKNNRVRLKGPLSLADDKLKLNSGVGPWIILKK